MTAREDMARIIFENWTGLSWLDQSYAMAQRDLAYKCTDKLLASPSPIPSEGPVAAPIAWRVKDFADGWYLTHNEAYARERHEQTGCLIQPLYLAQPPSIPSGKPTTSSPEQGAAHRSELALEDEHYQAAMFMNEKHRKLWVEASQENKRLRSALELAFKLPRPWIDGGVTQPEWFAAFDAIEAALKQSAPMGDRNKALEEAIHLARGALLLIAQGAMSAQRVKEYAQEIADTLTVPLKHSPATAGEQK